MINWGIIGFGNMGKQYFNCLQKNLIFNLTAIVANQKKKLISFQKISNFLIIMMI